MDVSHKILKTTLEREFELYQKYLETCYSIRGSIQSSDLDQLRGFVKEQEGLVTAITDLENSRQLLVAEFAEQAGIAADKVNLERISQTADESVRQELAALQDNLRAIIKTIEKENRINAILIGESLNYVQGTFEILAGVQCKKDTYTAGGKTPEERTPTRNILNKVV